jgi:hypothetical protein
MAAALSFAPSPEIERVAHALARELTDEAEAKQFIGIAEEMEAKAAVLTNAAGSSRPSRRRGSRRRGDGRGCRGA